MTNNNFEIPAECHSDDYIIQIHFDAVDWFICSTDEAIQALIDCEYCYDYPADNVARFFDESTTKELFNYQALNGCECSVDVDAAETWIKANRPHLNTKSIYPEKTI